MAPSGCAAPDSAPKKGSAAMNRTTVWILGTISAVILAFAVIGPFGLDTGYGIGRACEGPACVPQLVEVTFSYGPALQAGFGFLLLGILIGLPAWIASPIFAARRGASSKPVILPPAVISAALLLVSIYNAAVNGVIASPKTCFGGDSNSNCVTGPYAGWVALLGVIIAPALICAVVNLPGWITALIRTARIRAWGWFAAVLLLPPWTTLLYGFLGPEQPHSPATPPQPRAQPATA
jgi:hypothetical protein